MPQRLALLLTLGFIAVLFWRDIRQKPNVSGALWLPVLWVLIIASRPVSEWLGIFGFQGFGAKSLEEGSTVDSLVYFTLIVAGLCVLGRRQVSLSEVFRNNELLVVFFLYCLIAILWSDYSFVSFKRWIKMLGHPIMVLIVFTEPDPQEALLRLMKRSAYVLVPVSILFIKYYPALGREAAQWATVSSYTGIAKGKNPLGAICLFLGFFFFWHLLQVWRGPKGKARRDELFLTLGLLLMICYLLRLANSATAILCLLLSMTAVVVLGMKGLDKKLIGIYAVTGVILFVVAQLVFGVFGAIVDLTGHESTMEGREALWGELLAMGTNPIFGVGFESFWLGDRLIKIGEAAGRTWQPNEAHNGYLETYLNLGLVGLFILIAVIIAAFQKIRHDLVTNFEWGRFRMALLVAIIARNWTEAGLSRMSFSYFIFFIIAINHPKLSVAPVQPSAEVAKPEEEMELAYSQDTA